MSSDGADDGEGRRVDKLWAMAAELERQFAGYKQRLALVPSGCTSVVPDVDIDAAVDVDACASNGGDAETEAEEGGEVTPGRLYEAYTRRRDERLRSGWRARMERKEAQVMALWAQLDARPARGSPTTTPAPDDHDDGATALIGEQHEAEDADGGEKRRSSDVAAPGRVSGKKHARTTRRSFSSTSLKSAVVRPDVDVRIRRALSQEAPGADGGTTSNKKQSHRGRAVTGGATTRRKASSSSSSSSVSKKGSAKEHGGSLRPAGLKPPRGFVPRRCSSGGLEGIPRDSEVVVLMPVPSQSCSSDQVGIDHDGEDQKASSSSPEPVARIGNGTENASLPEEDRAEGTSSSAAIADGGEAEAEPDSLDVEKRDAAAEEITARRSPEAKLGNNGEMITSDSETEPSYVFIKKEAVVVVEEEAIAVAVRLSEALAVSESDAIPQLDVEGDNGVATAAPTAAEDAPSSSSFSGGPGRRRGTAPNTPPTCSNSEERTRSIERLLEADAALLRRKREESESAGTTAVKSVDPATMPGSAGSRQASGASPRGTSMGFKKRFLNFGKKNSRGNREAASVGIDCTSPSTPVTPSPADDGGRWQAAVTEEPDHGAYAASPQACSLQSLVAASPAKSELGDIVPQEKSPRAHRSFFSLRSFNCSRS